MKILLRDCNLISDEVSKMLIQKASGVHSSLVIGRLPFNGHTKAAILSRLYRLRQHGIFNSSVSVKGDATTRKWELTDKGEKLSRILR